MCPSSMERSEQQIDEIVVTVCIVESISECIKHDSRSKTSTTAISESIFT